MKRFSKQTQLSHFGEEGQRALAATSVLIIGCGGLASPVSLYLAAAGVGRLGLVDADTVEISNLPRQVLFSENEVGSLKVEAARKRILEMNASVEVECFPDELTSVNVAHIVKKYDILVDCTDNFTTKFLINDAGIKFNKPVVYGSVTGFEGQVASFHAAKGSCYRCLYPSAPKSVIQNCAEAGVLGPVVGVVSSAQALECLKIALDLKNAGSIRPEYGQIVVSDFLNNRQERFLIPRRKDCLCQLPSSDLELTPEGGQLCRSKVRTITFATASTYPELGILDVREENEFLAGAIAGAQHWALSKLESGQQPAFLDNHKNWLVYCARGKRSEQAVSFLTSSHSNLNFWSLENGMYSLTEVQK